MNDRPKRLISIIVILLFVLVGCEEPRPVGALSPATLPKGARLTALSFVDVDHGWVVAENCPGIGASQSGDCRALVYATADGGRSWSPEGRLLLVPRKLQFTDQSTGWLVGAIGQQCGRTPCPNVVMQTTDAGRSWQRTSTTSVDLIDESFVTPRDGWILGETCATPTNCQATLVSTQSSGQTWTNQQLPLTGSAFRLDRLNPSTGWIAGVVDGQAVLIATRDGGKTWDRLTTPCRGESLALDFRSPDLGWLACSAGSGTNLTRGAIYHTLDGGRSWQDLTSSAAGLPAGVPRGAFVELTLTSTDNGWIVDAGGEVLETRDGGQSWASLLRIDQPLAAGQFVDDRHGQVIGGQTVWATSDGGRTWETSVVGRDSGTGTGKLGVK